MSPSTSTRLDAWNPTPTVELVREYACPPLRRLVIREQWAQIIAPQRDVAGRFGMAYGQEVPVVTLKSVKDHREWRR